MDNKVKGAMNRQFMPDVMRDHPNRDGARAFNNGTNYAEGYGAEGSRIAERVYEQHHGRAMGALGNVMARRHELRGEPQIRDVETAPTAPLSPDLEALVQALRGQSPEEQEAAIVGRIEGSNEDGTPRGGDGDYYDAAALAKALKARPPWHRDFQGPPAQNPAGGPRRPMLPEEDTTGFRDGPHDPWRGKRGR